LTFILEHIVKIFSKLAVAVAFVALHPGLALAQGSPTFLAAPRDITVRFVAPPLKHDTVKAPYMLITEIDDAAKKELTVALPSVCVGSLRC
jgi:hypothetical protein